MKTDVLATQINEKLGISTNLGAMQRKVNRIKGATSVFCRHKKQEGCWE